MALDWAGYGYAALIASGGVMGYVKAGLFDSCFFSSRISTLSIYSFFIKKKTNFFLLFYMPTQFLDKWFS